MPLVNLINKNLRGEIGFFGTPLTTNSLVVVSPFTTVGGTVISTNPDTAGSVFNTWNQNTGGWSNWNPDEEIIPKDSKIEYAFLVWSTAYHPSLPSTPPYEDINNLPDIYFTKPDGNTYTITPDTLYHLYTNAGWHQYTNGADITSIMQDNQYGNYTVTSVPTGQFGATTGLGGWGVYILYYNEKFLYRNANLNVGATGFNITVTIADLALPVIGPVNTKLYLSSVQGDRGEIYPDSLLLNGVKLSGPFNPEDDFMNDRFVDYTGLELQSKGSLIVETGSVYGYYADQTLISDSNILKNSDTELILTQDNERDWAGVSFLGVLTALNAATLISKKSVDKEYGLVGDNIVYTIELTNIGSIEAIDIEVVDTLPLGLTFVPNSIKIDGIEHSGDITNGITIPNLGVQETTTIIFTAKVESNVVGGTEFYNDAMIDYSFSPDGNTIVDTAITTNIVVTTVVSAKINSNKQVNLDFAKINDILTYTIVLNNEGSLDISNIGFRDSIPSSVTLILDSLNQDGIQFNYNSEVMTLPNGVDGGGTSTISYQVVINDDSVNQIENIAIFNGEVLIGQDVLKIETITNIVVTRLAYIEIDIEKMVDLAYATKGSILEYTIEITNNGNIEGENLIFLDTIPEGTSYVANTLEVNGTPILGVNPQNGVMIGNIGVKEVITVIFKVKVNSGEGRSLKR